MSVAHQIIAVAVLGLGSGCSRQIDADDSWVLGLYTVIDDVGRSGYRGLAYRSVEEEGVLRQFGRNSCSGTDAELTEHPQLRWEMRGPELAVVFPPDGETETHPGSGITSWEIRRGQRCHQVEVTTVRDDEVSSSSTTWTRGKACLFDVGGGQFEDCRSAWCEGGEPEACD